jgi:hypothetical protein
MVRAALSLPLDPQALEPTVRVAMSQAQPVQLQAAGQQGPSQVLLEQRVQRVLQVPYRSQADSADRPRELVDLSRVLLEQQVRLVLTEVTAGLWRVRVLARAVAVPLERLAERLVRQELVAQLLSQVVVRRLVWVVLS